MEENEKVVFNWP